MSVTIEQLEDALIDGRITLGQFVTVLVDNFGAERAAQIIEHNVNLALQKECNETM